MKKENNAWLNPQGQGQHGWEEVPYWLKGFGDCAYILGDQEQIKKTGTRSRPCSRASAMTASSAPAVPVGQPQ